MSYRPKYFQIHELVYPEAIQALGERAWILMDDRILRAADWLREEFGSCVVNGKIGDKRFTESGLRHPNTGTGAPWSQHKFGRALDLKFLKVPNKTVYEFIMGNQVLARQNGITTVEDISFTTGWLHIDCRALPPTFPSNGILVVKP